MMKSLLGWARCPNMLAVGGTGLGDAWPWCGGPEPCLLCAFLSDLSASWSFSFGSAGQKQLLLLEQPFPLEISSEAVVCHFYTGLCVPLGGSLQ